uniref:RING-type E3 ubiquitin transferase n=1 Tax=Calcidiscus leptoporus TaxID=127549 RepID=A0A7S0P169_9EUKA|mmetsp:Transcript_46149/g.107536  ORF Transcript_46149/g.107536 Transcript_46149/m.107536 type:complete len:200 (+) Transcript_46149:101-700(+)|eukprot:CAMPEP_0119356616 /NCGR_PEP_ID=MMETSP1334-20130426/5182_1 /TAXON_ID=127549 /ORGANISM="Calcidiscus leptoporus, Strain RCC1130" /LENGTH=199 /DNA_ID=CAMNT_0007370689 /DNA_START=101 /DNA_END=700 /DNA_ORIENTATION=+
MAEAGTAQREQRERAPPSASGDGMFDCNICLEAVSDPVVTRCGHLYCWQCIYKWLQLRPHGQTCPICKRCISAKSMIPIYGRGRPQVDPRCRSMPLDEIPKRPPGQRPDVPDSEAEARADPAGRLQQPRPSGAAAGAHSGGLHSGLGFLPALFGLQLVTPPQNTEHEEAALSDEQAQQVFLSRLLLLLGCFVILCLLLF